MSNAIDLSRLPAHARLVARDDVRMEGEGVDQLARVAAFPGCVRAVGMPDLHAGRGIPVGAVFAFADRVRPALVGGDAGCGVRLAAVGPVRLSLDAIERRVAAALDDEPLTACDGGELFAAVWRGGPRALADLEGVPDALAELAALEPDDALGPSGDPDPYRAGFEEQLGSVGGGNHFVEIARVAAVPDAAGAAAVGLEKGGLAVLAHSGSRGLGGAVARRWSEKELLGDAIAPYLADLAGACRFARANRFVLAYRVLRALGAARPGKIAGGFDVTHNDVVTRAGGGRARVDPPQGRGSGAGRRAHHRPRQPRRALVGAARDRLRGGAAIRGPRRRPPHGAGRGARQAQGPLHPRRARPHQARRAGDSAAIRSCSTRSTPTPTSRSPRWWRA